MVRSDKYVAFARQYNVKMYWYLQIIIHLCYDINLDENDIIICSKTFSDSLVRGGIARYSIVAATPRGLNIENTTLKCIIWRRVGRQISSYTRTRNGDVKTPTLYARSVNVYYYFQERKGLT